MKLIVIESPYAGEIARNMHYLQLCIRWCIGRGYAPFASHQMYTSALDDSIEIERSLGIAAGFAWADKAELTLFFSDLGWSRGMYAAKYRCIANGKPYEEVQLKGQYDAPAEFHRFLSGLHGDTIPGGGELEGDQGQLLDPRAGLFDSDATLLRTALRPAGSEETLS